MFTKKKCLFLYIFNEMNRSLQNKHYPLFKINFYKTNILGPLILNLFQ